MESMRVVPMRHAYRMIRRRVERRLHLQRVQIDRRKGDDDIAEHVIGGVRRTTASDTTPHPYDPNAR
jgi:hypothetical protein